MMLYIVGTPIGNLEDLSIRQVKTIVSSEYILSEDTRSTGILLQKIKELFPHRAPEHNPQVISYYKDNEFEKLPQIMDLVRSNAQIALISEAGMPVFSDPGLLLVSRLVKESLPFTVIPGPTAAATALVYTGWNPTPHMFVGFLPKRPSDLRKAIERMMQVETVEKNTIFVAYESPNRISETLNVLNTIAPHAQVVIGRELTKKFEEILRGSPVELAAHEYKGEITLVISFARPR